MDQQPSDGVVMVGTPSYPTAPRRRVPWSHIVTLTLVGAFGLVIMGLTQQPSRAAPLGAVLCPAESDLRGRVHSEEASGIDGGIAMDVRYTCVEDTLVVSDPDDTLVLAICTLLVAVPLLCIAAGAALLWQRAAP